LINTARRGKRLGAARTRRQVPLDAFIRRKIACGDRFEEFDDLIAEHRTFIASPFPASSAVAASRGRDAFSPYPSAC
jgi:hypothetical protein